MLSLRLALAEKLGAVAIDNTEGDGVDKVIVLHELPLAEAPQAYTNFNQREKGWTKVVLKPGM